MNKTKDNAKKMLTRCCGFSGNAGQPCFIEWYRFVGVYATIVAWNFDMGWRGNETITFKLPTQITHQHSMRNRGLVNLPRDSRKVRLVGAYALYNDDGHSHRSNVHLGVHE